MIINQEYKIWKKEAPYYYDFLLLHSVDWPTFTFQWLPEFEVKDDYTSYYAIIASSSAEIDQCQLQKIRVDHPNEGKCTPYLTQPNPISKISSIRSPSSRRYNTMEKSWEPGIARQTRAWPPSPPIKEISLSHPWNNLWENWSDTPQKAMDSAGTESIKIYLFLDSAISASAFGTYRKTNSKIKKFYPFSKSCTITHPSKTWRGTSSTPTSLRVALMIDWSIFGTWGSGAPQQTKIKNLYSKWWHIPMRYIPWISRPSMNFYSPVARPTRMFRCGTWEIWQDRWWHSTLRKIA